jgi:hypothetical protein
MKLDPRLRPTLTTQERTALLCTAALFLLGLLVRCFTA